jgi:hypothetical protein
MLRWTGFSAALQARSAVALVLNEGGRRNRARRRVDTES